MDWSWVNWNHWDWVHRNWVDGDMVDGSWVWDGLVLREVGHTIILDVGHITARAIGISSVGDNLGSTIGKGNPVVACHHLGVRGLSLAKSSTTVLVLNAILEGIWLGGLWDWCWVNWCGVVGGLWDGSSGGQDSSKSNKALHLANCCVLFDHQE